MHTSFDSTNDTFSTSFWFTDSVNHLISKRDLGKPLEIDREILLVAVDEARSVRLYSSQFVTDSMIEQKESNL